MIMHFNMEDALEDCKRFIKEHKEFCTSLAVIVPSVLCSRMSDHLSMGED
jgi:hypothetical protein